MLRSAAHQLTGLGWAGAGRSLAGSLTSTFTSINTGGDNSQGKDSGSFPWPALKQTQPHFGSQFLINNSEEKQQRQNSPLPAALSCCSPQRLPWAYSRSPLGLAGSSRSPVASIQATRSYNAWTPAQRYFVEGDHVITSELNRTFQFTGLDSGSFYPFAVYTAVATVIATAFMVLPLVIAPSRVDLDKSSAYECGFDAFGEARQTFSVSFYLVSIMYLLFDIEIAYLFPYVMSHANAQMFWTMNLFLTILVTGFIYEWGVGALEWRE